MARFKQFWIGIKSSFWFIPAIINIVLICIAFLVIEFDHMLAASKHSIAVRFFSFQQDSVRTFLATIAGSMMTIAGVVFSITILVLAQTAGQYSSRVLRNFMRKKSNQVILGVFIGIFIFCLFLITNLHPTDNGLTTLSGFFLAIVGVGFLIYFIHQTSISIQASEIICNVYEETLEGIERIYPNHFQKAEETLPELQGKFHVPSFQTGYIQAIDIEAILSVSSDFGTTITLKKKLGDFIAKNETICLIQKDLLEDQVFSKRLHNALIIGKYRTAEQDVAFGIQQIVDIALRGLSPGINDLSTAQTAIDYLGSIYIILSNRDLGSTRYYKEDRQVVYIPAQTFSSFIEMGLSSICANAKGQPTIQTLINETIFKIKELAPDRERRAILSQYSCPVS